MKMQNKWRKALRGNEISNSRTFIIIGFVSAILLIGMATTFWVINRHKTDRLLNWCEIYLAALGIFGLITNTRRARLMKKNRLTAGK